MQQQASMSYSYEPVTSTTTATTPNNGLINQFDDYYNNNNYLGAQHYSITPDLVEQQNQPQQRFQQPIQPQPQSQQNHNAPYQYEQLTQQRALGDENQQDTLSFVLEEIGAVINGKEFTDITSNNVNQEAIYKQESLVEETTASIYENLKSIINEPSSNETTEDHHQNHNQHHHHQDYNLFQAPPTGETMSTNTKPYVEIIEQPSKCALRFRYKCEGRSAGSLPGVNSTSDNKTYPTIRINNYHGRAVVVISCVTKDAPYRAHPHNIVGKEGCKKGICTIVLNGDQEQDDNGGSANTTTNGQPANCIIKTFSSLGIQCVKRKDIEDSLNLRESINVDPYRNGFQHKLDTSSIDLNVVRLCFQVFIEGSTPNKCDIPLMPIVSDPIHDKKAMSDLVITKLSHCSAPATGGREVILLCDRIAKDDIQIRFFEEGRDGKLIWETYTDISPADVHKQVALCFKTPKYYNPNITQPVMARIQLRRISDNQVSEPRLFQFLPCESDEDIISRKRQKIEWVNNHYALDSILQ
jgi:hypothetical protein